MIKEWRGCFITTELAASIEEWVEVQRYELGEREYLELLCNYRDWLEEGV